MRNFLSFQKVLVVTLFVCTILFATEASASFLGSIGGKVFTWVLELIGFGSETDGYCWFCPLFDAVFQACNIMATRIAQQLRNVILMSLGIGVLFFIAFRVGATVIKLQEVDLMQFMGDLFKHLGRAIIAAAIITAGLPIFQYIITPFLAYSMNLAISFMNSYTFTEGGSGTLYQIASIGVGDLAGDADGVCSQYYAVAGQESTTAALSDDLRLAMKCMLATVSSNLILGMVVGLCVSAVGLLGSYIFPNIQQLGSGAIIFGSFFAIYLAVPFRLIDNLIRLAFVSALMPFWVILWVFPATIQYTKNAWNMFMATCVSFISFGVVIALIMQLLQYMIPDLDGILSSLIPGYEFFASSKASVFTSNTLLTLGLGIFCKQMLGAPDEFAARITQSYAVNVGGGVEQLVTKSAHVGLGMAASFGAGALAAVNGGSTESAEKTMKGMKKSLFGSEDKNLWDDLFGSSSSSSTARTPATAPTTATTSAPAPTTAPTGS